MRNLARPLSALFALWFAFMLGDPGILHTCAMHGGHGHGGTHGATHGASAAGAHDKHAMHGAAAPDAAHEPAPADPAPPDGSGPCTCIGNCCAVTAAAPLPAVAVVLVPTTVAEQRQPLDPPAVRTPAAPDRRLPFANGPPTV